MKRRYANHIEGDYFQKRIEKDYFTGYVCYVKIKNIDKPLIVTNDMGTLCIKDNNYKWIELYPDDGKYAITIMYDDNDNLIEWYFDISKNIGVENGIPYEDDLYLDMIITPEGKTIILDEEELLEAEKKKDITHEDVVSAYATLEHLKKKYVNDLEALKEFTKELKESFK